MGVFVKKNDNLTPTKNIAIRVLQTWRVVKSIWVKKGGEWLNTYIKPLWSSVILEPVFRHPTAYFTNLTSICYNNNVYFAVNTNGNIGRSNDGLTFKYFSTLPLVQGTQNTLTNLIVKTTSQLIFNNGVYLLVCYMEDAQSTYSQIILFESTNCFTWRHTNLQTNDYIDNKVKIEIYANNQGVCVVTISTGVVVTFNVTGARQYTVSLEWTPNVNRDPYINSLFFYKNYFVLWALEDNKSYLYALNGVSWTTVSFSEYTIQNDLFFQNNAFFTTVLDNSGEITLSSTSLTQVAEWENSDAHIEYGGNKNNAVLYTQNTQITATIDSLTNTCLTKTLSGEIYNETIIPTLTAYYNLLPYETHLQKAGSNIYLWCNCSAIDTQGYDVFALVAS